MEYYAAVTKKELLFIYNNMDEPGKHYAKWNKPEKERQINMVSLICRIKKKKKVKLKETESR